MARMTSMEALDKKIEKAQELVLENRDRFIAKWGFDPYGEK